MERNIADRYAQEIKALGEEGRRFAAEFPEAGKLLDLDNVEDRDPYVERMIESFAFLTSRSREAIDAVQDGLDQVFLGLVGGDLEEPLPALMISEFVPRRSLAESVQVPLGAAFESGPARQPIHWTLLHDHHVHPLDLLRARISTSETHECVLEWHLGWFSPSPPERWPDRLRFFLHGDAAIAWALRFSLLRRLARVEMMSESGHWVPLEGVRILPAQLPGYSPQGDASHPFSRMRDFLCADEGARFLDLQGLGAVSVGSTLSLRLHLGESMPRVLAKAVQASNFRFHAAITINRFDDGHCTLHCDHTRSEQVLRPEGGSEVEILHVLSVEGVEQTKVPTRVRYAKHGTFRHGSGDGRFFRTRRGLDRTGRSMHFLSVAHREPSMPFEDSFLVVRALFCDGNKPHEMGSVRDLRAKGLPRGVGVSALSRPGPRLMPPAHISDSMRLHPLAAVHFQGLMDAIRLRDLLRLWIWDPAESKRGLVESILSVSSETGHEFVGGVAFPLQTIHLRMRDTTCAVDTWERLGAIDAFGAALAELFSGQVPLGYRCRLDLVVEPCGVVLEFGQRR